MYVYCILFNVSGLLYPVYCILFTVSGLLYPVYCIRLTASCLLYQVYCINIFVNLKNQSQKIYRSYRLVIISINQKFTLLNRFFRFSRFYQKRFFESKRIIK
uniref:Putative secreted protein n=1 Tax=Rhodnius prolixus TaxID=13249 RepID=R4G467_RHOPR